MPRRHHSADVRRWLTAGSAGLALCCAACAGPNASLSRMPVQPPVEAVATADSGVVRLGRSSQHGSIHQVAFQEAAPNCPPDAIVSCPPEPRYPVAGPSPWAVGMPACDIACQPSPARYPDEYLCDGGDRDWPVHYSMGERYGLDTEDTIAEFTDHHGKERTSKSNKVCVYAPRFAAVRTVSLPHEEGTYQELARTANTHLGGEMRTRLAPNVGNRNLASDHMQMRSRASGLIGDAAQSDASQRVRPQVADKILNTFQDLNFFQFGTVEQGDMARLNLGIRSALVWSREQYPVIEGKVERAETGLSEIHASVLTVIDDQRSDQPGQLRVVKVADKDAAAPGDVITFTIRYDNLGPRDVEQVRIVDNLTPRLEYVDDSATSDRAGRLVVQDNGEGSLVLVWEFANPLPAGTGGVVTFQALVR